MENKKIVVWILCTIQNIFLMPENNSNRTSNAGPACSSLLIKSIHASLWFSPIVIDFLVVWFAVYMLFFLPVKRRHWFHWNSCGSTLSHLSEWEWIWNQKRERCEEKVRDLRKSGCSVLLSTEVNFLAAKFQVLNITELILVESVVIVNFDSGSSGNKKKILEKNVKF